MRARPQLIGNVGIVIFLVRFLHICIRVSAFAPQGKVPDGMSIRWFHILVITYEARELMGIGGDLLGRSLRLQQILRVRPSELIALGLFEPLAVGGLHFQMGSLQPLILLIVVDLVLDGSLLVVAALVDGLFGESRSNHTQLAEMSPALTFST